MDIYGSFIKFHTDHPDVYEQIVSLARKIRDRGYERYGIATLFEVVRYHRATSGKDEDGWKLNNNFRSHYARLIMQQEPDLDGFFETRALRSVDREPIYA